MSVFLTNNENGKSINTLFKRLVHLYKTSRYLLNNSFVEKEISHLENQLGEKKCLRALHDAYFDTENLEFHNTKSPITRVDCLDTDEIYDTIYSLKSMRIPPFNILFSRRNESVSLFSVRGDSMYPILSDGDIVVVSDTDRIYEDKITLVEVPEGKLLKRVVFDDGGYLLISDNKKYPTMWVHTEECRILGVVIYIIKSA